MKDTMTRASSPAGRPKLARAADTDAYLASVSAGQRAALQRLRTAIRAAVPSADEGFSYGLPAFKLDGRPLVCFGAARNHCSFFPMSPAVITAHAAALKGYDISKGTIRFVPEKPLPAALVRTIVRARVAELNAGKKR